MKILYATSECVPFVKSGGLADVAGSLPKELRKLSIDIRVVLPRYQGINDTHQKQMKRISDTTFSLELEGVTYYFLEHDAYFNRENLYGYSDDGERFSFFSCAVLNLIDEIQFIPDIIHINDWHTSMIPLLYKKHYQELYPNIKTVLTIHNLRYQGIFNTDVLKHCQISLEQFYNGTVRMNGQVNFLKTGIVTSDFITTVSPTYSKEILDSTYGEGLENILSMRKEDLVGILNGIDVKTYDPSCDPFIPYHFDLNDLSGKALNKRALQEKLGLPTSENPLIGMVTRLTNQKGFDLLSEIYDELLKRDLQLVILGTGEFLYEEQLRSLMRRYRDKVRYCDAFNIALGQEIYAGADFLLMPSLFEPCGLSQLIAMRYGTIPIVRETGGLKDTVIPFNEYTLSGTGFGFKSQSSKDLLNVIQYALDIYQNKDWFTRMRIEAMKLDLSWDQQTLKYLEIYEKILRK